MKLRITCKELKEKVDAYVKEYIVEFPSVALVRDAAMKNDYALRYVLRFLDQAMKQEAGRRQSLVEEAYFMPTSNVIDVDVLRFIGVVNALSRNEQWESLVVLLSFILENDNSLDLKNKLYSQFRLRYYYGIIRRTIYDLCIADRPDLLEYLLDNIASSPTYDEGLPISERLYSVTRRGILDTGGGKLSQLRDTLLSAAVLTMNWECFRVMTRSPAFFGNGFYCNKNRGAEIFFDWINRAYSINAKKCSMAYDLWFADVNEIAKCHLNHDDELLEETDFRSSLFPDIPAFRKELLRVRRMFVTAGVFPEGIFFGWDNTFQRPFSDSAKSVEEYMHKEIFAYYAILEAHLTGKMCPGCFPLIHWVYTKTDLGYKQINSEPFLLNQEKLPTVEDLTRSLVVEREVSND